MKKQYEVPSINVLGYNRFASKYISTSDLNETNPEENKNDLITDDKVDYFG